MPRTTPATIPSEKTVSATIREIVRRHGARVRPDAERGVRACARVWPKGDPGFREFCGEQYVPPGRPRTPLLRRLDEFHHAVSGNLGASLKVARAGLDIADRPDLAAERVLSAYAPASHLDEDYRREKIAALAQLNFGTDDRRPPRSRAAWAARRVGQIGREAIPPRLLADYSRAESAANAFVSEYNLRVDQFDFGDSRVRFPKNTLLVSHWGLRDHLASLYGEPTALPTQRALADLLRRVVDGDVPREVLGGTSAHWDLVRGRIREGRRTTRAVGHGPLRWECFRKVWEAHRRIDPHREFGSVVANKFLVEREMTEDRVVGMLEDIVSSPLAERVGRFLRDALGRELEPFDIYCRKFASTQRRRKRTTSGPATKRTRYADAGSLHRAIVPILRRFGWTKRRAEWIRDRIRVDNGRSAGHAWPPYTDTDTQLLRVRVGPTGVDDLNFEVFMHELGHCVEGVLSSYEMDYRSLWGVPNTAFTEGFAFTFQDRTDFILGRAPRAASDEAMLLRFWEPFEIAGSALTEIRFYHWLYDHPRASADQMMRAIRRIADAVWEEFYARVLGPSDLGLLAVYSHILTGDFYLADYPLGYIVAHQVRRHLAGRSGAGQPELAEEMERLCSLGRIYPDSWMKAAVGSPVSAAPLLDDTERALSSLGY